LKILAVSDVVVDRLYSAQIAEHFRDIDMILGCGDLPYEYLEFLVSVLNVPLLYVPGNHDPQYDEQNPAAQADGCDILDQRVTRVKGLNLAGLGGSIRYKPVPPTSILKRRCTCASFRSCPVMVPAKSRRMRDLHTLEKQIVGHAFSVKIPCKVT